MPEQKFLTYLLTGNENFGDFEKSVLELEVAELVRGVYLYKQLFVWVYRIGMTSDNLHGTRAVARLKIS